MGQWGEAQTCSLLFVRVSGSIPFYAQFHCVPEVRHPSLVEAGCVSRKSGCGFIGGLASAVRMERPWRGNLLSTRLGCSYGKGAVSLVVCLPAFSLGFPPHPLPGLCDLLAVQSPSPSLVLKGSWPIGKCPHWPNCNEGRAPPVVWRVDSREGESSGEVLPPPSLPGM